LLQYRTAPGFAPIVANYCRVLQDCLDKARARKLFAGATDPLPARALAQAIAALDSLDAQRAGIRPDAAAALAAQVEAGRGK
jgi:hypothetical protein